MLNTQRFYLETNGQGYWSNVATEVEIEDVRVAYINDEQDFGELRVYFATSDWDVNTNGLIYTDKLFMQQFKQFLEQFGFTANELKNLSYSEQGMQGDNYVSMDLCSAGIINKFKTLEGANV
jgi:hypothetical protein